MNTNRHEWFRGELWSAATWLPLLIYKNFRSMAGGLKALESRRSAGDDIVEQEIGPAFTRDLHLGVT